MPHSSPVPLLSREMLEHFEDKGWRLSDDVYPTAFVCPECGHQTVVKLTAVLKLNGSYARTLYGCTNNDWDGWDFPEQY